MASKTVGVGPWWLRWLIIAIIIAAILVALWLFMNMKVLPKKIDIERSEFKIEGEKSAGAAHCRYTKSGKKGWIRITSPNNSNYPMCKCSIDIQIEADSPRRVRSKNRRVIISATPGCGGSTGLNEFKVGASSFRVEYDDEGKPMGIFMRGQKPGGTVPENYGMLQNGSTFKLSKDVNSADEGTVDVIFKGSLIFK